MNTGRTIDHFVVTVPDLDRAAAAFEALGFTLTPRAQHPWGTANRLAQFTGGNFIELLEIDRPALIDAEQRDYDFGGFTKDFLSRGLGPSMLVLATEDAEADTKRYAAAGIASYARFDFERTGRLPDGSEAKMAFSIAHTADPAMPSAGFFTCQNRYPENFWKPEFQVHGNGAQEIVAVYLAAADPAAHGEFLSGFSDGTVSETADGIDVSCGTHAVHVLTPEAAAKLGAAPDLSHGPRFIGAAIVSDNPPTKRSLPDASHGMLIVWR
ncbi:MAG: VOC family protein [Alphaproteobacteria bacterium]